MEQKPERTEEEVKIRRRRMFEEAKTRETLFCPVCDSIVIVQISKDWSRLYGVYCENCGFNMKAI